MILALDVANKTGWAIGSHIYGTYKLTGRINAAKLVSLGDFVLSILNKNPINFIAMEAPLISYRNRRGSMYKGQQCGIVEMVSWDILKKPTTQYAAGTIKKWLTGNGRASKHDMILAANQKFKTKVDDDHQADALAIWGMANEGVPTMKGTGG